MIDSTADGGCSQGMAPKSRDLFSTTSDFAEVFGDTPTPYLAERIERYDFGYRTLTPPERDEYLRLVTEALLVRSPRLATSA